MIIQHISPRQLRAARALLNWSRSDLAEHSGLSELTIHRIENDLNQPGTATQATLRTLLDEHGIEFTDNDGVKFKPQGVEVLIGQAGLQRFFSDVYEYLRKHGGAVVQLGVDENLFWAMGIDYSVFHRKRMSELVRERKDIRVQAIICEGDTNFICSDYNEYRWISKEIFAPVPFYIYGETLAIMDFQTVPGPTIVVHKFPAITQAYRKQFNAFWKMSSEPRLTKKARRA